MHLIETVLLLLLAVVVSGWVARITRIALPLVQIALGADFRITAPDARWSVLEARWGLVPDMSGIRTLTEHVRPDVAKRLTMTGEEVDGTRAVEIGLATQVASDPGAAAQELVEALRTRSPDAVAATKRGAHLAVRLERLDALLERPAQRIGLSATVRPVDEVARWDECVPALTGMLEALAVQAAGRAAGVAVTCVGHIQAGPGLRVVDASVFPEHTTVNPNITVMLVGERCAELVRAGGN